MSASLRSNVIVSTVAMVLVGGTRPAFNFVVNVAFGAEANGRAATIIASIFLAALPATAAIPTVMLRNVSRAIGANENAEASGHARMALIWTLILAALGAVAAIAHSTFARSTPLGSFEAFLIVEGVVAYSMWRLFRTLLIAIGEVKKSIAADAAGAVVIAILLSIFVMMGEGDIAAEAFIAVYVVYAIFTLPIVLRFVRGGVVSDEGRREFVRYNVLWFIATAASLAARELTLLILDERASKTAVGEVSVALSVLTMLAFAPRIIEVPLVHELAVLGAREDRVRQVELTNKALDWLTVLTIQLGFLSAILAAPILALAKVRTPEIVYAFVIIAAAFSTEMVVTPAANLVVSESDPRFFTLAGAGSLLIAYAFWYSPWCEGAIGVVTGLALSFVAKGVAIAWYARRRHGVVLLAQPIRKVAAFAMGTAALFAVHVRGFEPWIAAPAFAIFGGLIFLPTIREITDAAIRRT